MSPETVARAALEENIRMLEHVGAFMKSSARSYKIDTSYLYVLLLFLINLFIFIYLAALGLYCCTWAVLFVTVHGLLIAVASLVVEHEL